MLVTPLWSRNIILRTSVYTFTASYFSELRRLTLRDVIELTSDEEAVHIVRQRAGLECDDVLALSLLLTDIEVEPPAREHPIKQPS